MSAEIPPDSGSESPLACSGPRTPPTREEFVRLSVPEREACFKACPSAGSRAGLEDPVLHISWNRQAIHAAADAPGGPHVDALQEVNPRNVQSLESALTLAGGTQISDGLFAFETPNGMHSALQAMFLRYPWVRHGHPSHAEVDVVHACTVVNWIPRMGFAYEEMLSSAFFA